MLHDNTLKDLILKKLQQETKDLTEVLGNKELLFDNQIGNYKGIKLHHGYVFLQTVTDQITYPRGIPGKYLIETYKMVKGKKIHCYNIVGKQKFKVKPKVPK